MAGNSIINVVADLETPVWVKVRFGREVRDVRVTAVHNKDKGKQRYIYFDGVFHEDTDSEKEHVCEDIAITDVHAKYHNKLVALSFMQEEAEMREQERIEEQYGAVLTMRITTAIQIAEVQAKMMPSAGRLLVSIDEQEPMEILNSTYTMQLSLHKGSHVHCAVVGDDGTEYGIADVVVSKLDQLPLLGVSAREPLTFYVFVNGEAYAKRQSARKPVR